MGKNDRFPDLVCGAVGIPMNKVAGAVVLLLTSYLTVTDRKEIIAAIDRTGGEIFRKM